MKKLIDNLAFLPEEFSMVEELFFGNLGRFNDQQKKVIDCFTRENIQACPGSGKTTTLAAKLLLLKNRISSGVKGGVCILTHTNVAVDIIKERLGAEATAFYCNYPNYLGTIQSFINKYLAVPCFKQLYGKSVEAIDDDIFFYLINKRNRAFKASSYLSRNKGIDDLGLLSFNIHNFDISASVNDSSPIVGKHTDSYKELEKLKQQLFDDGYLKYDEAYALAYRYLREHPELIPLFSMRFPLVFLDEMQDTESFQFGLLEQLFGSQSVLQTIGDGNQDIYGHFDDISKAWSASSNFSITTSSRFPQHLADVVQKVAVDQQSITGRVERIPIRPYLIVYQDSTIGAVKEKFAEIIITNGLHNKPGSIFKAVGARKNERLSIVSYFSDFNKSASTVKTRYPAMADYLHALNLARTKSSNIKDLAEIIYSIILEALRLAEVKDKKYSRYYTTTTLNRYLHFENIDFHLYMRVEIEKICKDYLGGKKIESQLSTLISTMLLPFFSSPMTIELNMFLTAAPSVFSDPRNVTTNFYKGSHLGEMVDISFDTLHSVKGETHTATLYLETFTRTYDIPKLLPLMSGTQSRSKSYIRDNKKRMKEGFVAMTRPTDLLALAVNRTRIDLSVDWNGIGYNVVYL